MDTIVAIAIDGIKVGRLAAYRHFATHYAELLPLTVVDAPFDFPRMRFYQLWHERSHLAAPHRWFRKLVQSAARGIGAPRTAMDV